MKKILSIVLVLCMVVGLLPAVAFGGEVTAKIGDVKYGSLDMALHVVKDGETIELSDGTFNCTSAAAIANVSGKTFTIEGKGSQTTVVIGDGQSKGSDGYCDYRFEGASVTFKNLVISEKLGDENYQGFVRPTKLTFTDCEFLGRTSYWGNDCTIENCVFTHDTAYDYCLWTWGCANMTIKGSTFNTQGKAIKMYGEGTCTLTVQDCIFNSNGQHSGADKPAVAINTYFSSEAGYSTSHYTLYMKGCTQNGFVAGATGSALYGSDLSSEVQGDLNVYVDDTLVWLKGAKNAVSDPTTAEVKVITSTEPVVVQPYGTNAGQITLKTDTKADVPETAVVMNTNSLISAVATADELKAVRDENKNLAIVIDVKKLDAPSSPEVQTKIAEAAGEKKVGLYLDLSLYTQLDGETATQKHETNQPITISILVPEELRNANEGFAIVRVHNGEATVLTDEDDYDPETGILTLTTDKFSDYALIMTPKTETQSGNPATGMDGSSALPAAVGLIVAAIGLGAVMMKKRQIGK